MHAPMWTFKHQVVYGHVTLGLKIHFPYFKSTQYFQNMFFYQFMHSSESILGVRKFFTAFTLQVYHTYFLSKTGYDQWNFQRKAGSYLFSKACWLLTWKIYFLFLFVFVVLLFEVFCYLNMCIFLWGIFAIYMRIQGILLSKHTCTYFVKNFLLHTCISKVFSLPKHTYICFARYFCYIHAYPRYLAT